MSKAAVTTPPAKAIGVTKLEAVRQTIQKLGKDVNRADLQSFVKKQFGFEMSLDYISTYKSNLQNSTAKTKKPNAPKAIAPQATLPKPAAVAKAAALKPAAKKSAAPKPPTAGNGKTAAGIGLDDIRTAKELIARVGPDHLRGLIDLLEK